MEPTPTQRDPLAESIEAAVRTFDPAAAKVQEVVANAAPLLEAKDAPYKQVREGRLELFRLRNSIEAHRKELKNDALRYGRAVDTRAKELIGLIEPTERELKAREDALAAEEAARKEAERQARAALLEEALVVVNGAGGESVALWELEAMSDEDVRALLEAARPRYEEAKRATAEAEAARVAEEERRRQEEAAQRDAERAELERARKELAELRAKVAAEKPAPAPVAVPEPAPAYTLPADEGRDIVARFSDTPEPEPTAAGEPSFVGKVEHFDAKCVADSYLDSETNKDRRETVRELLDGGLYLPADDVIAALIEQRNAAVAALRACRCLLDLIHEFDFDPKAVGEQVEYAAEATTAALRLCGEEVQL